MARPKGFISIPKRLQNKSPSYLSTYEEYIRKSKVLDERLKEIEKAIAKNDPNAKYYQRAYREAYSTARARQKSEKGTTPRFNRTGWITERTHERSIEKALAEVERLLSNPLTTRGGVKSYMRAEPQAKKAAQTIYERYGIKLNPWEMKQIFESLNWEKMKESYGSKTAIMAIATIKNKGKRWENQIKKLAENQLSTLSVGEKVAADIIRRGLYG